MEVLKMVSVVAMGSDRAAYFASRGIAYQRFSSFTRTVRPRTYLDDLGVVARSCTSMIDISTKLQKGYARTKADGQLLC